MTLTANIYAILSQKNYLGKRPHIDFVHEKRHMDAGGGGGGEGGWRLVTFLGKKSCENFDSLIKIYNILKSSIQSIQNPASIFISVFTF